MLPRCRKALSALDQRTLEAVKPSVCSLEAITQGKQLRREARATGPKFDQSVPPPPLGNRGRVSSLELLSQNSPVILTL